MLRSDRRRPQQQQQNQTTLPPRWQPQLQQPQVVQQPQQMMHQGRYYPPVQTRPQGGSVDGSTHGGHKHRQHHHESHKSLQREGHSHKSSKRGGQRREKHSRDSRRSSRREGSSCQGSESGAWSEEEGYGPSSRTSVCSSTDKVLHFFDDLPDHPGNVQLPPSPPATIADDVTLVADDVGSDSGQSESSTITVLGPGSQPQGYSRSVYRERSVGARSAASLSTASSSEYSDDDESESGDNSAWTDPRDTTLLQNVRMLQDSITASRDHFVKNGPIPFELECHFRQIRSYTTSLESYFNEIEKYHFTEVEPGVVGFSAWSPQRAPAYNSMPAGAVQQIYEPYTIRSPRWNSGGHGGY